MEKVTIETMRAMMRLAGFEWSDAELEALRPLVETNIMLLDRLEAASPRTIDPSTQYRLF